MKTASARPVFFTRYAFFCGESFFSHLRSTALLLLAGVGLVVPQALAQPVISSVNPTSGPVGSSFTISSSNFSATPANNTVHFGAVKATVTAATATNLTVTVLAGAEGVDSYDGFMKDAAIWNRVLSPLEVKSLAVGVDVGTQAFLPNNLSPAASSSPRAAQRDNGRKPIRK